MGLAKPALRFIVREHGRKPFSGPVLTLGRQHLFATLEEARTMMMMEGVAPSPLQPGERVDTNIPEWAGTSHAHNVSDVVFFRLLGLADVQALDYSDFEGAEILHDLNLPAPDCLRGRFGLIVDGGTLEHIFDVRQSMSNVAAMLKPGGRVIHVSPTSNWVNHGFFQFSPTLFYDYYAANGFVELRAWLAEHDAYSAISGAWEFFEIGARDRIATRHGLMTVCVAEKTDDSTSDRVPNQSHYAEIYTAPKRGGRDPKRGFIREMIRRVKDMRPNGLKRLLRRLDPRYERRKGVGRLKPWDRF